MIGRPPVSVGAVQVTVAVPMPDAVATTLVGEPGTPYGMTAADGAEAGLLPTLFIATTTKV